MLLPQFLPLIINKQKWFSLIGFQDKMSNVSLHAEPFLWFFCSVVDLPYTMQEEKSCKIGLSLKFTFVSYDFKNYFIKGIEFCGWWFVVVNI